MNRPNRLCVIMAVTGALTACSVLGPASVPVAHVPAEQVPRLVNQAVADTVASSAWLTAFESTPPLRQQAVLGHAAQRLTSAASHLNRPMEGVPEQSRVEAALALADLSDRVRLAAQCLNAERSGIPASDVECEDEQTAKVNSEAASRTGGAMARVGDFGSLSESDLAALTTEWKTRTLRESQEGAFAAVSVDGLLAVAERNR